MSEPLFASMFVKPAPGLIVMFPDTYQLLSVDGGHVPRSTYWLRRLREGDVIELEPPAAPTPPPAKPNLKLASAASKPK